MYFNNAASFISLNCIEHLVAALFFNHSGNVAVNPFCGVERNCLTAVIDVFLQLFGQSVTLFVGHLLLFLLSCLAAVLFSRLDSCFLCCRCLSGSFGSLLDGFRSLGLLTSCEYGLDSLLVFVTCCCHEGVQLLGCHLSKFLCCHNTVIFELLLKCYCLIFILQRY